MQLSLLTLAGVLATFADTTFAQVAGGLRTPRDLGNGASVVLASDAKDAAYQQMVADNEAVAAAAAAADKEAAYQRLADKEAAYQRLADKEDQVSCGNHSASSCANCPCAAGDLPQSQCSAWYGAGWCNGQCAWAGGVCTTPPAAATADSCGAEMSFALQVKTHTYSYAISWKLVDECSGETVESSSRYQYRNSNRLYPEEYFCLPRGKYHFEMNTSYGYGLCCRYGQGYYTLKQDGALVKRGDTMSGGWRSSETTILESNDSNSCPPTAIAVK